jgi:hypothetical protein
LDLLIAPFRFACSAMRTPRMPSFSVTVAVAT